MQNGESQGMHFPFNYHTNNGLFFVLAIKIPILYFKTAEMRHNTMTSLNRDTLVKITWVSDVPIRCSRNQIEKHLNLS